MEKTFEALGFDIFTVTIDPPSIAAGGAVNVDVPVAGLAVAEKIVAIPPDTLEAGLVFITAGVPAAGTLRVRLYNPTAAAIDGAARTWVIIRIKTAVSPIYPRPT